MAHRFGDAVVSAVLTHMNGDHGDDNLLITRAFTADPTVVSATMAGFDGDGGEWRGRRAQGDEVTVRMPWPGGPISERPEVRRAIVALYDEACAKLGLEPRPHADDITG